jgi:hypothetical protein
MKKKHDSIQLKGFFRAQIVDKKTKKIVGDSGWNQNVITNAGFESCIVALPFDGITNSAQGSYMILGDGTDPATDATSLPGANTDLVSSFAGVSVVASLTARATQVFEGSDSTMAALKNIGILLDATNGSLLCGQSFPTSALSSDQQVNASYELRFSRV